MASIAVTSSPTTTPIIADLQHVYRRATAWRPRGTKDWVLIYTLAGKGGVRCNNVIHNILPGSAILIVPQTPHDYGLYEEGEPWTNIWVHFHPRGEWLSLLKWPEIGQGTALMSFSEDHRGAIEDKLHDMVRHFQGPSVYALDFAMNALEHVLLLASEANQARVGAAKDKRIQSATHLICNNLTNPISIAAIAKAVGLSRTRFSVLFSQSVGCSPQEYVEIKRLERVAHLLTYSSLPIGTIAEQAGFSCPFYLSRRFSRRYQTTPTQFRDNAHGAETISFHPAGAQKSRL